MGCGLSRVSFRGKLWMGSSEARLSISYIFRWTEAAIGTLGIPEGD